MRLYVTSCNIHKSIHDNEKDDSRGDDGRRGIMSQDTIHSPIHSHREIVDGDGISGYMFQTGPSPSHNQGEFGILLIFFVHGHDISGHRSQTSHHYSYNCGGIYIVHQRLHQ